MTEEEYFRKTYPDSCYGDKPLSPHWDFFQGGVEFSERQSEEKIKDLTEQNISLLTSVENLNKTVQELEQENAELKEINEKLRYDFGEGYIQDEKEFWEKTSYLQEQLTKAKKIIRALLKHTYGQNLNTQNDFDLYLGRIKEAEQFLKEVEK